jgi:hypothetical protein
MKWDFFETLEAVGNVVDFFSNLFSIDFDSGNGLKKSKETKYIVEKISCTLLLISAVLLFFVFKKPLPEENYTQTLIVASLIGMALSSLCFFILHVLERYYFKSLFQMLLFSGSVILFFISLILAVYFKSGLFA